MKNKLKGFLLRILQDFIKKKKNNSWNIRRMVEESFVTSAQQTIVLYYRLTDFLSLTTYHPCVHLAPLLINNVASSLYHNAYHTTSMA